MINTVVGVVRETIGGLMCLAEEPMGRVALAAAGTAVSNLTCASSQNKCARLFAKTLALLPLALIPSSFCVTGLPILAIPSVIAAARCWAQENNHLYLDLCLDVIDEAVDCVAKFGNLFTLFIASCMALMAWPFLFDSPSTVFILSGSIITGLFPLAFVVNLGCHMASVANMVVGWIDSKIESNHAERNKTNAMS